MRTLAEATQSARKRTGDGRISTTVRGGLFRVVRVTYPYPTAGGKALDSTLVEPLSDWMPLADTLDYLDAMTWTD